MNELIDYWSYQARRYVEDKASPRDVVDSLIRDISYPFYGGKPDDKHVYNAYHGKWCRTVELDYWDSGSEVLATRLADCDGSAISAVTCLRAKGVEPENTYVAFGYVTDLNNRVLGGHAFTFTRDKSFNSDQFVLNEMTLDEPPLQYPEVGSTIEDLKKPHRIGNWIYHVEFLWNDKYFIKAELTTIVGKKKTYFELSHREKETAEKYRAIEDAFKLPTKPLKRRRKSFLAKLRWR